MLLRAVRTVPVEVGQAFDRTLSMPLELLFHRGFALIPAVAEARDHTGDWRSAGQSRTVLLRGPGTMREELLDVERPHSFRYRLSRVTGPMRLLVSSVDGEWTFEPAGTGVCIAWSWDVTPASVVARLAMPVFGAMWRGYARRALEHLADLLV